MEDLEREPEFENEDHLITVGEYTNACQTIFSMDVVPLLLLLIQGHKPEDFSEKNKQILLRPEVGRAFQVIFEIFGDPAYKVFMDKIETQFKELISVSGISNQFSNWFR